MLSLCVCLCVEKGLAEYYSSHMCVCLCLSITCSAAQTPISHWSVFNLNHIATPPHRPTHWQGQLSWLEVKWDDCVRVRVCVHFILKGVIRILHWQIGGDTPFVLLLYFFPASFLLYALHTLSLTWALNSFVLCHTDPTFVKYAFTLLICLSKYILEETLLPG